MYLQIILLLTILDVVLKNYIDRKNIRTWNKWVRIEVEYNYGFAGGIWSDVGYNWVLCIFSMAIACIFIGACRFDNVYAHALWISGLSNFVDVIINGYVIDYIYVKVPRYPIVANISDILIYLNLCAFLYNGL